MSDGKLQSMMQIYLVHRRERADVALITQLAHEPVSSDRSLRNCCTGPRFDLVPDRV